MTRERDTLKVMLLPDGRIASERGAPLPASRWRRMGGTGPDSSDICFIAAKADGQRRYARVTADALHRHAPGLAVTLKRSPKHSSASCGDHGLE